MSKLSFRARALDACKPLPVFRCEDLPDLHEYVSINRAVPQMPTGMEKDEESEHHLQRAISAQQVYGEKRDNMVIPVPEAECNITHYESLYPGEFRMPKQLIHIQPFSLDTEQPDYDLDSEDDTFVNKLKKKMEITHLQFEEMIDRLEKGSGQQPVNLQEAKLLLKEDDELIKEVFDYWNRKRKTCKSGSLIPSVKQEKRDGSSTSDPYVAFRRRTEKMQTRKNRKNDEASYEKMLKLRRDLSRTVTILEMIKKREKVKRELLHLTLEVVEKRYVNVMPDFGSEVMAEALAQRALVKPVYTIPIIPLSNSNQYRHQDHMDMKDYKKPEKAEVVRTKRKYEKKPKISPLSAPQHSGPSVFSPKDLNQYDFPSSDEEPYSQIHSGSSEAEEESDPDGCYAFRRKAGCQYYSPRPDKSGSWPWVSPSEGGIGDLRFRYCPTSLSTPRHCVGLARRRVGRGGRILLDRAYAGEDGTQSLDSDQEPEPLASPLLSSSLCNSSTSENITSDSTSSSNLFTSRILLNIKSCRWRHFRPRTLSHHPLGGGALSGGGFRDSRRTTSGLTQIVSAGQNRRGPATAPINGELVISYISLASQQKSSDLDPLVSSIKALVSKTLDQASAQFAASALITTDQLLGFKSKEELVLASGVNGVLTSAGVFKNLHLTSTMATLHQTNQSTHTSAVTAQTFLQPSNSNILAPAAVIPTAPGANTAAALGLLGCSATAPATTQVLIGNNICLSMQSAASLAGRHIPRTLGNMPASALKLSTSTNLQMPKVSGASSMDMGSRDNHDEDKPALNSLADNTVAMEVT
uniref:Enhancer of polycomb homolog n=1 Tax=Nothobranchius furzeri TaxID=105023 RepID=A0A8C6M6D3_NOTFU